MNKTKKNKNILEFPTNKLLNKGDQELQNKLAKIPNDKSDLKSEILNQASIGLIQTEITDIEKIEVNNKKNRLDELSDWQLEKYSENFRLMNLIENENLNPSAAIKRAGAKRSARAIAYLFERYKMHGKIALIDQRWNRQTKVKVLTSEMKNLINPSC